MYAVGFCRNSKKRAEKGGDGTSSSESQAVELVSCRHDLSTGAMQRPLLDHVHGLDPASSFLALQNDLNPEVAPQIWTVDYVETLS